MTRGAPWFVQDQRCRERNAMDERHRSPAIEILNPCPKALALAASVACAFLASCGGADGSGLPFDQGEQVPAPLTASSISWKGHTWNITSGGMAGVAPGSLNNVFVDANGYLHLKITNSGGTWTAAELFSADRLGFGTYQWQIDAPIDRFD